MNRLCVVAVAALCAGCEPKWSAVTLTGLPECRDGALAPSLSLKVEGPRVSSFQRVDGRGPVSPLKLEQGKRYTLTLHACRSEPCEAPGNLVGTQSFEAPGAESGSVAVDLKGVPACPVKPPEPPAEPAAAAPPDAG